MHLKELTVSEVYRNQTDGGHYGSLMWRESYFDELPLTLSFGPHQNAYGTPPYA